jgi:hypothetical protein
LTPGEVDSLLHRASNDPGARPALYCMLRCLSEVENWPELEASYSPSPDDGIMCVALYVTLDDLCYTYSLPTAVISRRLPEQRDKFYP